MSKLKSFAPYLTEAVLPFLFVRGYVPNAAGEIVTHGDEEYERFEKALFASLGDAAKFQKSTENRAQEHVFTFQGCKIEQPAVTPQHEQPSPTVTATIQGTASPLDALRDYGITTAEGEPFTIKTDHGLSCLRAKFEAATAELPEGHGWRLFALLDPAGTGGKAAWRVTVGRADAWPFPSATGKPADATPRGDFDGVNFKASRSVPWERARA